MTRGAEPRYADTAYAQWIKRELERRGWEKQDLAAKIREKSGGRLGEAGAEGVVRRATHGKNINAANTALVAEVLGPVGPSEIQEADLSGRLAALEAAVAKGSTEVATSLLRLEEAIGKLSQRIRREVEPGRKAGS